MQWDHTILQEIFKDHYKIPGGSKFQEYSRSFPEGLHSDYHVIIYNYFIQCLNHISHFMPSHDHIIYIDINGLKQHTL